MTFRFADLFAGIGGFHAALSHAGGECVYVSEIDAKARRVYSQNWLEGARPGDFKLNGDLTKATTSSEGLDTDLPDDIDVLTAGFPCQPFSKSGFQRGMEEIRGTLFWEIARILKDRRPKLILLENVRNLAGPQHRHEWEVIIETLHRLGYKVSSTPTVLSPHLIHPEDGGTPQVRDRVFILGTLVEGRVDDPALVPPTLADWQPRAWDPQDWRIDWILDDDREIENLEDYRMSEEQHRWVSFWDSLIQDLPWWKPVNLARAVDGVDRGARRLPGFPLWAEYWRDAYLSLGEEDFADDPPWKRSFILKNIDFYRKNRAVIRPWRTSSDYASLPMSRRKLEWQAQWETSLWDTIMHFRPSGIRAKRATYFPALVAINQTSVIGSRKRVITPHEAARLQGLGRDFFFPSEQRDSDSYRQVGNGVCVGAAWTVLVEHVRRDEELLPPSLARAILDRADANCNPSRGSVVIPEESETGPTAMSA